MKSRKSNDKRRVREYIKGLKGEEKWKKQGRKEERKRSEIRRDYEAGGKRRWST